MILLLAVLAGLLVGSARAWAGKWSYTLPALQATWLAAAAILPQWLVFFFPATRAVIPGPWPAVTLVTTQALLLAFVWSNRRHPGFYLLGAGLALNLLVISLNGGLMPINPETASQLFPGVPFEAFIHGERLGWSKDVVLQISSTRLWQLSDRFLLPDWFPYRSAFSIGDVLVSSGAFWFLWGKGGPREKEIAEVNHWGEPQQSPGSRKQRKNDFQQYYRNKNK